MAHFRSLLSSSSLSPLISLRTLTAPFRRQIRCAVSSRSLWSLAGRSGRPSTIAGQTPWSRISLFAKLSAAVSSNAVKSVAQNGVNANGVAALFGRQVRGMKTRSSVKRLCDGFLRIPSINSGRGNSRLG
ncbi:hypothetical protein GX51_00102 [Blastomyces parvus]|uniref:Uncharacterized protein n=1 Tax=Blastomyces parvus TaxID=2060905 RepID=A0A2B7XN37_9EURO|nr:hypothetical protein GX51_00102 [Blastomyces parvus]